MKKYLVQFCIVTDENTGEIGGIRPQYLPTKGVIIECDNEGLSNIMGGIFEKFPQYRTAIVSEIKEKKGREGGWHATCRFQVRRSKQRMERKEGERLRR